MDGMNPLHGEERLEVFPPTGQRMRMGAPERLLVSDYDWIRGALSDGDWNRGLDTFEVVFTNHRFILAGFTEWCLQLPTTLAACLHDGREREVTRKAVGLWKEELASLRTCPVSSRAVDSLIAVFPLESLAPGAVAEHRRKAANGEETLSDRVMEELLDLRGAFRTATSAKALPAALEALDSYFVAVRSRHDAFTQLTSSYSTAVLREYGQETAEEATHGSFASLSFHEPLFALAASLSPEQLAAFFAEHLRSHLSGPGRKGAVRIVEEEDRYRLVFEPCGTGGALRGRLQASRGRGPDPLPGASAATWGRKNEVPAYCSHCAMNELKFIRMVGHPAIVTEFDPDPNKPCGWTIHKDPGVIPEAYFRRLGLTKGAPTA